ncbi:MAG: hypothetical protein GQ570_03610 [Helicobacteraceae bacterium]|nr:hypothetical protein [Helicobacteraceae bacterium]
MSIEEGQAVSSEAGKGSETRPTDMKAYGKNHDSILGKIAEHTPYCYSCDKKLDGISGRDYQPHNRSCKFSEDKTESPPNLFNVNV